MRTLAIGDVHGCRTMLANLLAVVKPRLDDTIVTLGDYIDRGPDSKGVIDCLLELHAGGKLVALRGNHEIMMAHARNGGSDDIQFWLRCGGLETLQSYVAAPLYPTFDDVPEEHWRFISEACLDWYETDTHIFVHANLHPQRALDQQTTDQLHWQPLSAKSHQPHYAGKIMICGHTEQRNGQPLILDGAVCIDTWAYGGGWLTCLDVDSGEFWQANEHGQTRRGILGLKAAVFDS